jgi:cyclopropane-fatty-acyl-phospholipid synthase
MTLRQEEFHDDRPHVVDDLNDANHLDTPPVAGRSVAARLAPLLDQLFLDGSPIRFEMWDQSALGPTESDGVLIVRSPNALRRLIWSPNDLGIARAYITGDIDVEGDLVEILKVLDRATSKRRIGPQTLWTAVVAALRLGAIGSPPKAPEEEARLSGWRHSKARDAAAISHHYDVSSDFYRLVLGPAMTYSCARFVSADLSLAEAQRAKHDLVCRKLGLHERPAARLLDVGCGWGSMAIHAASTYNASVTAITLSPEQEKVAKRRVLDAGVERDVEVRLEDYRDLRGETYDAISSIGMFEHVGSKNMNEYFSSLYSLLPPGGRLLNHAISTPGSTKIQGPTFINRYVFPDGELIDVAEVVSAMEHAGFEVRDVESLREHYVETLHAWVANLEHSWDEAVALVGEPRARIWRLYMAGSANAFEEGRIAIHQVLGVRPDDGGKSGMPRTRLDWH